MSAAPPARAFRRDYDMALTREDFLRLLPVAVGGAPFRVQGGQIDSLGGDPAWRIRLEPRAGRPFGPVRIPVLAVALTIEGPRTRRPRRSSTASCSGTSAPGVEARPRAGARRG